MMMMMMMMMMISPPPCFSYENTRFDGRFVVDFNLRDDGGHTPLFLAASWGHEQCVRLLLQLPHVHPCIPDVTGVSPEETARRVGYHGIANAISTRAKELGVDLPAGSYWDEPDKRWYLLKKAEAIIDDDEDDDHPME
jgi:ankyrin repeat protein